MNDNEEIQFWEEQVHKMEHSSDLHHVLERIAKSYEEKDDILTAVAVQEFLLEKELLWNGYYIWTSRLVDFATLIILNNIAEKFEMVYVLISDEINNSEHSKSLIFPIIWYKYYCILGHISKYWRKDEDADIFFGIAEKFSDIPQWPFRYHKKIGVVQENDTFLNLMKWHFERKALPSIDEYWYKIRDLIEKKALEQNWIGTWENYRNGEEKRADFHRRYNILWQPIVDHLNKEYWLNIGNFWDLEDSYKEYPEITPYLLSLLKDWRKYKFNIWRILWVLTDMDVKKYWYREIVEFFQKVAISWDDWYLGYDFGTLFINLIPRNRSILVPVFLPFLSEKKYWKYRCNICYAVKNSRDPNIIKLIVSLADDEDFFYMFSNSQWRWFWKKNKPEMLELWWTKEMKKKRKIHYEEITKESDEWIKRRDAEIFSLPI